MWSCSRWPECRGAVNIDPEPAAGWISGRRYLVLLDHAWNRGSPRPVAISGAEHRVTVGVMPVRLFESLERNRLTRPTLRVLVKRRGLRDTWDVPSRPRWNIGEASSEQGCPTVPRAFG